MAQPSFHRPLPGSGWPLYWILAVYLVVTWFHPVVGWAAIVCMLGPVLVSVRRGRWWCGHVCPRGSFYDRVLARVSPHRPIPGFVRTTGFRVGMVLFIFAMFGVQMHSAWGDWGAMGMVFWRIILLTTAVGVVLALVYAPRTWCSFCPMGTLSAWVAPKKPPFPAGFRSVLVDDTCNQKCRNCARVCPMQLRPWSARGEEPGYLHPDCLKCGKCETACPRKSVRLGSVGGKPAGGTGEK